MTYIRIVLDVALIILLAKLVGIKKSKRTRTQLVFTIILNKSQIKILKMQLDKQKFVDTILALVNADTQEAIADATFNNVELESSDTSVFTVDTDPNNDGILDILGVGEGTGTLTVKAVASYTDPNTQEPVSESKTATLEVTVTNPPPGAIKTEMIVTLSEPQSA